MKPQSPFRIVLYDHKVKLGFAFIISALLGYLFYQDSHSVLVVFGWAIIVLTLVAAWIRFQMLSYQKPSDHYHQHTTPIYL